MLNGCELFAEVGEDRIDLRSNETLELIDDFKRFQIDHHQSNLDRFHLIGDDHKRPWRFVYPNVVTGCLKVYAIEVAVWREDVLDGLEVKELCFNAHGKMP
ncbi:hypothetical protein D3C84_826410 [compost metagenome]